MRIHAEKNCHLQTMFFKLHLSLTLKLEATGLFLKQLPKLVTNVLSDVETDPFLQEVHRYNIDTFPPSSAADGTLLRIGHWWTKVSKTEKYPPLCKISFAMLSCFHGPQVKGSFNTMGDVIDPKSCRMNWIGD